MKNILQTHFDNVRYKKMPLIVNRLYIREKNYSLCMKTHY